MIYWGIPVYKFEISKDQFKNYKIFTVLNISLYEYQIYKQEFLDKSGFHRQINNILYF